MSQYNVIISGNFRSTVAIEADDAADAEAQVMSMWAGNGTFFAGMMASAETEYVDFAAEDCTYDPDEAETVDGRIEIGKNPPVYYGE